MPPRRPSPRFCLTPPVSSCPPPHPPGSHGLRSVGASRSREQLWAGYRYPHVLLSLGSLLAENLSPVRGGHTHTHATQSGPTNPSSLRGRRWLSCRGGVRVSGQCGVGGGSVVPRVPGALGKHPASSNRVRGGTGHAGLSSPRSRSAWVTLETWQLGMGTPG